MPELLEGRLADLGRSIDWPPADGLAERVGARLREGESARTRDRWPGLFGARRLRRSLLVAVAALLLLAAAVAAAGILLPGLRIVVAPPGSSVVPGSPAPPAGGPPGASLGLGTAIDPAEAEALVGFEPRSPASLPAPDAAFVDADRLTLVWRSGPNLPETKGGLGLLLTEIPGRVDAGYFEKQIQGGVTAVEPVTVEGQPGYWISGEPHALVYRRADGTFVEETRRIVGDVLIWRQGDLTLRLESGLGRDATIAVARTVGADPSASPGG